MRAFLMEQGHTNRLWQDGEVYRHVSYLRPRYETFWATLAKIGSAGQFMDAAVSVSVTDLACPEVTHAQIQWCAPMLTAKQGANQSDMIVSLVYWLLVLHEFTDEAADKLCMLLELLLHLLLTPPHCNGIYCIEFIAA